MISDLLRNGSMNSVNVRYRQIWIFPGIASRWYMLSYMLNYFKCDSQSVVLCMILDVFSLILLTVSQLTKIPVFTQRSSKISSQRSLSFPNQKFTTRILFVSSVRRNGWSAVGSTTCWWANIEWVGVLAQNYQFNNFVPVMWLIYHQSVWPTLIDSWCFGYFAKVVEEINC